MTFNELITKIRISIYQNDKNLITGENLQSVLLDISNYINDNYYKNSEIILAENGITFSNGTKIYKENDKWILDIDNIKVDSLSVENLNNIIKEVDVTIPTDSNVMSSLRTIKEINNRSTSKTEDDTAQGHITFENGITTKGISTIDEADIHTLKADSAEIGGNLTVKGTSTFQGAMTGLSAEFSGLMKAAAATVVGLMTVGSLSANSGTIDNFNSDIINVATKVTSPLFVGALQGNADTATRLQTARKLWGNDFAGDYDIDGDLTLNLHSSVVKHAYIGGDWAGNVVAYINSTGNYASLCAYGSSDGISNISLGFDDYNSSNRLYVLSGGNVGIGTTSPSYKLHVNGDIGATTAHLSNLSNGYIPYNTSNGLTNSPIRTEGSKVGIGISPAYELDVAGTFRATSDMFADGNIGTRNYVSQTTGWRVDNAGNSDFRKIYADELNVQAFTAQISQALAGSDFLTKSVSKLSYNFVIPSSVGSTARLIVDDLEGFPATQCFVNGDYIRLRPINKTGGLTVGNVYGTVTLDTTFGTNGFLNSTQAYTFTATSISNGAGLTVYKGSEVLDYGTSGNGLIKRTVLDAAGSPYMDIDTWSSDPSNPSNYTTHVRLGNLAGVTNCNGYGLYSDNVFLTKSIIIGDLTKSGNYLSFDTVNGLQIKLGGTSVATTADVSSSASSTLSAANTAAQGYATTAQNAAIGAASTDATNKANDAVATANGYTNTQISIVNGNITSAISSIQTGGTNLLLDSNGDAINLANGDYPEFASTSYGFLEGYAQCTVTSLLESSYKCYKYKYPVAFSEFPKPNADYVLSFDYKSNNNVGYFLIDVRNIDDTNVLSFKFTVDDTGGIWKRGYILCNWAITSQTISLMQLSAGTMVGNYVSIRKVTFVKGNKPFDWFPAPQDITNAINAAQSNAITQAGNNAAALYVTQTNYNSYVSQTDQAIQARVTTNTFNALGDRVTTAEGSIIANANAITQKVSTTDYTGNTIASLINQTATTVKIQASQIHLDGAVTFASFNSDLQNTVNAKADASTVNTQIGNAITTAAGDATTKANNAISTANVAAQGYVTAYQNQNGTQLLPNDWTVGTGGTAFYYQNGLTSENSRIIGQNHKGENVIMWQCSPSGDGYPDGGWETRAIAIDNTKAYRFSVFVRKMNAYGTFYLGCEGNSVCDLNTANKNANPYFFYDALSNYTGKWILITGYVFPAGVTGLNNLGEVWDCDNGKRLESGLLCFNWAPDATHSQHRCYLFYDDETSNRQYLWAPRVDLVDGNEPSIAQLLGMSAINAYTDIAQQAAQTYATTNCVQVGLSNAPDAIKNQVLAAAHGNFSYIDGSSIYTGTLNANQVTAGYISADRIAANSITTDKLATNVLAVGNISGLGDLATQSSIAYSSSYLTGKPSSLADISSTEGTKLSGIAAGATVGATWGTNISGIPSNLAALTGSEAINNSTAQDNLATQFGYTNYADLVAKAASPSFGTLTVGGYIRTSLIQAEAVLTNALAAHKITADDINATSVAASVASVIQLNASAITSGTISTDRLDAATIKSNIVNAAYISSLAITTGTLTVTGGSHLGALSVATDGSLVNGSAFSLSSTGKLTCNNVDITGKITATTGTVGGFAISSSSMTNTSGNNEMLLSANIIRFTGQYSSLFMGADTFPSSGGGAILSPMRVEINRSITGTAYGNIGSYYSVQGAIGYDDENYQYTGNNALYIASGKICGVRFRTRRISTSQTLSKMDSFIYPRTNDIILTLPNNCEDGQWYLIKSEYGTPRYTISSNSGNLWYHNGYAASINVGDNKDYLVRYDAVNQRWALGISAL